MQRKLDTTRGIPRALAVAASDSSGAAGLQADLKTFEARQVYGLSALTAITAQDSTGIKALHLLDSAFVAQQISAVLGDIGADAVKTGLLLRAETIEAVADTLETAHLLTLRLIVDPVLVAGDGRPLVDAAAITAYRQHLFPQALMITPNLDEARILTGRDAPINSLQAMHEAARQLVDLGPRFVLIKGGHLTGDDIVDVLYDGVAFHDFHAERLPLANARGTGCTFAACITAEIAKGVAVVQAVTAAKTYLTMALAAAVGWQMGKGRGTLFHGVGRPPIQAEG